MRFIVAPDSYKGSLSAVEVSVAIEEGILSVFPNAIVKKIPIADGGEGTVEAIVHAMKGAIVKTSATDPLGNMVSSYWGLLKDRQTAIIEVAAASGLLLVPESARNPLIATSYGTGQLIQEALDHGARKLIIGLGGSATNDGGIGMLQALGGRFLDEFGEELKLGDAVLQRMKKIDMSRLDPRLKEANILIACDVDNPLCGKQGASAVYGPQKGATPEMVEQLDYALFHYSEVARAVTGRNAAIQPGAGAAGGIGAALLFFTNARLKPGVEIILETVGFERLLRDADVVFTGEGRTDGQTANGKAPVGVAKLALKFGIPTICLSGSLGDGCEDVYEKGIDGLASIVPGPMSLEMCMDHGAPLIRAAAARICRILHAGMRLTQKP